MRSLASNGASPGASLDRVARPRRQVAVPDIRGKARSSQSFRHFDGRTNGAMAPAGAAECDGQIGFAGGPVAGNPVDEKRLDAVHRLGPGLILLDISPHLGVSAGQRPKFLDPV